MEVMRWSTWHRQLLIVNTCRKLQALVYDILSSGGGCRKAVLGVCTCRTPQPLAMRACSRHWTKWNSTGFSPETCVQSTVRCKSQYIILASFASVCLCMCVCVLGKGGAWRGGGVLCLCLLVFVCIFFTRLATYPVLGFLTSRQLPWGHGSWRDVKNPRTKDLRTKHIHSAFFYTRLKQKQKTTSN